ncbi:ABC transporter substrate-binding protein [Alphaproteobacteria bacterium]|nr:ABC transporter substrate-binding protein [Alphaproteobacteria bacterium]
MMVQNTTQFNAAQHRLPALAGLGAKFRIIMAAVLMLGFTSQASTAGTGQIDAANNLVAEMMVEVESILAQDSNHEMKRTEKVSALFDRYFDLPTIAKFSAGPYWRAADATQKAAYEAVIRDVIIGTVVRNFDQLSGLKFTITGSQAKGKKLVLVNGTFAGLNAQQPPIAVGWRVVISDEASPLILDVEIENISMLVTQKQENIAIIRQNKGQFASLINAMKQRIQPQN